MKFTKAIFAAISIATLSATVSAHEGSTGTTGGGDYLIDAWDLLPRTLVLERTERPASYHPDIAIGEKKCWGVFPCTVWAWKYTVQVTFDREEFKRTDGSLQIKVFGRHGTYSREMNQNEASHFVDFGDNKLSPLLLTSGHTRLDSWTRTASSAEWDGQNVTDAEVLSRITKISETVLAQLDIDQLATIRNVLTIDRFLKALSLERITEKPIVRQASDRIIKHADELDALASRIVVNGKCDPSLYSELRQRLAHWVSDEQAWLTNLRVSTGVTFGKTEELLLRRRSALRERIYENIDPYCLDTVARPDLPALDKESATE